jgi:toxin ParE1/3/4
VKPFRFHPLALAELEAAVSWYADRSLESASRFAALVDAAIGGIRVRPEAWALWPGRDDVRRRVLRRFPYSVVFLVREEVVVVVAIAHHKRRPGYWLRRLRTPGSRARSSPSR